MRDQQTYQDAAAKARLADDLPTWQLVDGHLVRRFATAHWKASMLLAGLIGHLAEAAWHHPDLLISWGAVEVRLRTHSADGITDKDFELAGLIEGLANWRPGPDSALDGTPDDAKWRYLQQD